VELRPRKAARVLVVEDERDIADILEVMLERQGYEVAVAYDGVTGLALAKVTAPDVVLLNYLMPRMNGLQVLAELRSDPRTRASMRVIMTSALANLPDFRERARRAGAFSTLGRPHSLAEMIDLVEASLGA
jgi:CheY-like chemotaxis protein